MKYILRVGTLALVFLVILHPSTAIAANSPQYLDGLSDGTYYVFGRKMKVERLPSGELRIKRNDEPAWSTQIVVNTSGEVSAKEVGLIVSGVTVKGQASPRGLVYGEGSSQTYFGTGTDGQLYFLWAMRSGNDWKVERFSRAATGTDAMQASKMSITKDVATVERLLGCSIQSLTDCLSVGNINEPRNTKQIVTSNGSSHSAIGTRNIEGAKPTQTSNIIENPNSVNARIATIKKQWGAILPANALEVEGETIRYGTRDFAAIREKNGGQKSRFFVSLSWRNDPKFGVVLHESYVDPATGWYGWWQWKIDPKTNQMKRKYGGGGEADIISVGADGVLEGHMDYGRIWGNKNVTIQSTPQGMEFVARGGSGDLKWQQAFTEIDAGQYRRVYDQVRLAEMQKKKSGGGGIGGLLAGAAIGGLLSGGSVDGIVAGARVLGTKDGAEQVYNENQSRRAANEREAARSEAAFQASMRALQTRNTALSNTAPTVTPTTGQSNQPSRNIAVAGVAPPTSNAGTKSPANAIENDPVRYFSCMGITRAAGSDGMLYISTIHYGVVTSRRDPYDVLQRFKQQTGSSGAIDSENAGGNCSPYVTNGEAESATAKLVKRDSGLPKAKLITGVNFNY